MTVYSILSWSYLLADCYVWSVLTGCCGHVLVQPFHGCHPDNIARFCISICHSILPWVVHSDRLCWVQLFVCPRTSCLRSAVVPIQCTYACKPSASYAECPGGATAAAANADAAAATTTPAAAAAGGDASTALPRAGTTTGTSDPASMCMYLCIMCCCTLFVFCRI